MRCQLTVLKQCRPALSAVLAYLLTLLHCNHALSADSPKTAWSGVIGDARLYLLASALPPCAVSCLLQRGILRLIASVISSYRHHRPYLMAAGAAT